MKSESAKVLEKVLYNYNKSSIIKENKMQRKKAKLIQEAKEEKKAIAKEARAKKEAEEAKTAEEDLESTDRIFINKFIEYNELVLLNKSNAELISIFEKTLGEESKAAIGALAKKQEDRERKIKRLAKELTSIKDEMLAEAEKMKKKELLVSLYNNVDPADVKEGQKMPPEDKDNKKRSMTFTQNGVNVVEDKK